MIGAFRPWTRSCKIPCNTAPRARGQRGLHQIAGPQPRGRTCAEHHLHTFQVALSTSDPGVRNACEASQSLLLLTSDGRAVRKNSRHQRLLFRRPGGYFPDRPWTLGVRTAKRTIQVHCICMPLLHLCAFAVLMLLLGDPRWPYLGSKQGTSLSLKANGPTPQECQLLRTPIAFQTQEQTGREYSSASCSESLSCS